MEAVLSPYLQGWERGDLLLDLIQKMMEWDPKLRISPQEVL